MGNGLNTAKQSTASGAERQAVDLNAVEQFPASDAWSVRRRADKQISLFFAYYTKTC